MITKYSSTSYKDVLELSFEEIDMLYNDLIEIIEMENEEREKALEESKKEKK